MQLVQLYPLRLKRWRPIAITALCLVAIILVLVNVRCRSSPKRHVLLDVYRGAFQERGEIKKEARHVVFAKVHKAAGSTVMNILLRFGFSKNLTFMLPRKLNLISNVHSVFEKDIVPTLNNRKYDILCNHVIFNKKVISKYFPSDTKYITILRNPSDQMVSAFMYFRQTYRYLKYIPGVNPLSTYLRDPLMWEPKNPMRSYTNNRMSIDLGCNPKKLPHASESFALRFIEKIEKDFDLVLITEYFDESIILLRRLLGWSMKDVLYISANVFDKRKFNVSLEDQLRLQRWSWLDGVVYSHFYNVFWRKVFEQGPKFFDEVLTFQYVRRLVFKFCSHMLKGADRFRVSQTKWNPEFDITKSDCSLMTMPPITFLDVLRSNHKKLLKDHGINFKFK